MNRSFSYAKNSYVIQAIFKQWRTPYLFRRRACAPLCLVINGRYSSSSTYRQAGHVKFSQMSKKEKEATIGGGVVLLSCVAAWVVYKRYFATDLKFPYVVIGNNTAGLNAARGIRLQDPKAKVLMIGENDELAYNKVKLSAFIFTNQDLGETLEFTHEDKDGKERVYSIYHEGESYYMNAEQVSARQNGGVALINNSKVKSLWPKQKTVRLNDGRNIAYENLCIATEMKPKNLPVLEKAGKEVAKRTTLLFSSAKDFSTIHKIARGKMRIAVIGSGALATEVASNLGFKSTVTDGLQVCQICKEDGVMYKLFPEYLSKWATDQFDNSNYHVDVFRKSTITKCRFDDKSEHVVLTLNSGEELYVDHIVVADEYASEQSTLKQAFNKKHLDTSSGHYLVDDKFQSQDNVWVVGEGVVFNDPNFGRRHMEGEDFAKISGRKAGENMAGANKPFSYQPEISGDLCDGVSFSCFGICDSRLSTVSYFPLATETDLTKQTTDENDTEKDPYKGEGFVCYVRDSKVVGMMLWNMSGYHMWLCETVVRQVLRSDVDEKDIPEIAKRMKLNTFEHFYESLRSEYEDELGKSNESEELGKSNESEELEKSNESEELEKSNESEELEKSNESEELGKSNESEDGVELTS